MAAMRDLVRIERMSPPGGIDDYGNSTGRDWEPLQPVSTFWGDLRAASGTEALAAGRKEATARAVLRLRYGATIVSVTSEDRVIARGATWAIVAAPIDPDGLRRELELILERGIAVE